MNSIILLLPTLLTYFNTNRRVRVKFVCETTLQKRTENKPPYSEHILSNSALAITFHNLFLFLTFVNSLLLFLGKIFLQFFTLNL